MLTTEGTKGGEIFLAIKSSQLIGEKKEWNLSSSWRRENKRYLSKQGAMRGICAQGSCANPQSRP